MPIRVLHLLSIWAFEYTKVCLSSLSYSLVFLIYVMFTETMSISPKGHNHRPVSLHGSLELHAQNKAVAVTTSFIDIFYLWWAQQALQNPFAALRLIIFHSCPQFTHDPSYSSETPLPRSLATDWPELLLKTWRWQRLRFPVWAPQATHEQNPVCLRKSLCVLILYLGGDCMWRLNKGKMFSALPKRFHYSYYRLKHQFHLNFHGNVQLHSIWTKIWVRT